MLCGRGKVVVVVVARVLEVDELLDLRPVLPHAAEMSPTANSTAGDKCRRQVQPIGTVELLVAM